MCSANARQTTDHFLGFLLFFPNSLYDSPNYICIQHGIRPLYTT